MALNINGTTGISGVDGSASAPALQGTDSNTGINFASDTVNINTGGVTRATVNSSGNFSIGSTSNVAPLNVKAETDGNLHVRPIGSIASAPAGSGIGLDVLNDAGSSVKDLALRGSTTIFRNASAESMRIDSSGNVLVGRTSTITVNGNTSNATFEQHINGSWPVAVHASQTAKRGYAAFYAETGDGSSSGDHFAYFANQTNSKFLIFGNGDVDNRNNSYGQISDETLKQDIVDAASQWNDIKNLRVRKFRFKDNPTGVLQIGVVAQEVETVSAGLVKTDDEGIKSVKYSVLYMKAVKALQEAQARIETLEAEKTQMKTDLTALTARVAALEAG